MIDQGKLNAVEGYLRSEFPGSEVRVRYEPEEQYHVFEVLQDGRSHRAIILDAFLGSMNVEQIPAILAEFTLVEHLRELGTTPVVVTPDGLKLLGD